MRRMNARSAPLRMQLNTFFSGPQAWLFLAEDRGYLRDEGLSIEFTEGDTAANVVPRMAAGGFDIGYGDLNALIEHAGKGLGNAPTAVFASYNASPYTIAFAREAAVTDPLKLAGRTLAAHPNDAAMMLFPELCRLSGLDATSVDIEICSAPHSDMVPDLLKGRWGGMFGFVNTLIAASIEAGIDPNERLHFMEYNDHLPDLYGMAVLASPQLVRDEPETIARLLRALNRGLQDTVDDIDAAIDSLARRKPGMNRESDRRRLEGTLRLEMAHREGATLGIGQMDMARFQRSIDLICATRGLPNTPAASQLFNPAWLPPLEERVTQLARGR